MSSIEKDSAFMTDEQIKSNLKTLQVGDRVAIIRKSPRDEKLCDYFTGTVVRNSEKTILVALTVGRRLVKKEALLSIAILEEGE